MVRKISDGIITAVAGTGQRGYSGDGGLALAARLNEPYEARISGNGDIFLVEMRNNLVRKIEHMTGRISTVAEQALKDSRATEVLPQMPSFASRTAFNWIT